MPDARVRQFFGKFGQSFLKLEKATIAPNEHQFGYAHALISKAPQDGGSTDYDLLPTAWLTPVTSLFGDLNTIDKITEQPDTLHFLIPSLNDIEEFRKYLPINPEPPSPIVLLGATARDIGGSCEGAGVR